MPFISVVMPVYNQERFIAQAVACILAQTFTDFELIIVDDGSTDRTTEVLAQFDDPRIRYRRVKHQGFIKALLQGYKEARGTWIARMDSDDVCHPERLERQVEFLKQHPECVFVGTAYGFITPNDYCVKPSTQFEWRYVKPASITLGGRVFGDPTVVFHRQTAEQVGYYDPEFDNENALWYRLLHCSKGAVLGESLYLTRWVMGSVSRNVSWNHTGSHFKIRMKYDPENAAKMKRSEDFSARKWLTNKVRQGVSIYLGAGDRNAAVRLAWAGWKSFPLSAVRTKMLLYAILGIEGVRTTRMRERTNRLVRCLPPNF